MPSERIHNEWEQSLFSDFFNLPEKQRTMNRLYGMISKKASEFPREAVEACIAKLPDIFDEIIAKKGKRTKC